MSLYENDALNNQSDNSKKTSADNQNQNKVVFDGGTYSDQPTTVADVERNDDLEHGDHGTTTMTPTNDLPRESDEINDFGDDDDNVFDDKIGNSIDDDDDDFDDVVGEDDLDDADGFNANSDDPTERELTKTWMGNEKDIHDANTRSLEGDPMGGQNFGTGELEQKNNRDASSSEHHSLGLGNSALNQPSEEISNPPSIENDENVPQKKVDD